MKRRNFIKTTSLATVALSVSASQVLGRQTTCTTSNFSGTKNMEGYHYMLTLVFCPTILDKLEQAPEGDRTVKLELIKFIGAEESGKSYTANYKITSSKQRADNSNVLDVVAERTEEIGKDLTPPSEVDFKKFKFTVTFSAEEANSAMVKDKKGNEYITVLQEEDIAPADCFLTTACVGVLGKPDDCMELRTLRTFRDTILINMQGGKEMIEEYYSIAPAIVQNINTQSEKEAIYLGIYNNMIVPVLDNISNNQNDQAVSIYRDYTLGLKTKYGN